MMANMHVIAIDTLTGRGFYLRYVTAISQRISLVSYLTPLIGATIIHASKYSAIPLNDIPY